MRLTFLGTGGVWAAPVHGCTCSACEAARADPSRARGPASALLEVAGQRLLIDAGRTDLVDRFPPHSLDGVLLTHFHADHCLGLTLMRWSLAEPLADFSTLSRRQKTLAVNIPYRGSKGPLHLLIVSLR